MKRSKTITLVLLTGTLLLGCGEKEDIRNKYASWDDCVADYKDPAKCKMEQERTSSGMRMYYFGPWYRSSQARNSTYNPSFSSGKSIGVSRGGFGSSARSSSS